MITIYYDSHTGNVQRFINKLEKHNTLFRCIKITSDLFIDKPGHLITYTTKIGEVSEITKSFLSHQDNHKYILSVSSSGNRNWGIYYAVAADILSDQFNIPIGIKFELSGTQRDVLNYINKINHVEMCYAK
ncbi:MAG: class Ib ribonucleoside-diphosphate reductase assembly flavoprotein NrdI [Brevinema sp.]